MHLGIENPANAGQSPLMDKSERHIIDDLLARLDDLDDLPTESKEPATAARLRQQESALNEDLRMAMLEGNASTVIRLRTMLIDFPARILAADCDEIKRGLDNATQRLTEVEEELDYVREERKGKNRILAERLVEARAAEQEVFKDDFKLDILKMEQTSLHQARREYRLKLEKIMTEAASA